MMSKSWFPSSAIIWTLKRTIRNITLMDEKSGEFEAGDGNQNMVTFEVSE